MKSYRQLPGITEEHTQRLKDKYSNFTVQRDGLEIPKGGEVKAKNIEWEEQTVIWDLKECYEDYYEEMSVFFSSVYLRSLPDIMTIHC